MKIIYGNLERTYDSIYIQYTNKGILENKEANFEDINELLLNDNIDNIKVLYKGEYRYLVSVKADYFNNFHPQIRISDKI